MITMKSKSVGPLGFILMMTNIRIIQQSIISLNFSIPVKSGLKTHSTSIAVLSPEPKNVVNGD